MNAKHIAALALVAAAAGSAFAETPTIVDEAFVSSATRAQVQAELAAYRQAGVNPWSISYNPLRGFQSQLTREQVTADYVASRDTVAALTSEDSGSAYLTQVAARRVNGGTTLAGQPVNAN
jgi:hypothetical protein